jgi:hypothetical protein
MFATLSARLRHSALLALPPPPSPLALPLALPLVPPLAPPPPASN